jgi:hypothetical protein
MPKTTVRSTYRQNPDGVGTHKVKAHKRDVKGARKHATASIGFQPVTPARASTGALIGGATYWLFSGTMSVLKLIGFSLTVAVGLIMGYDKVQKHRSTRYKAKKRSVALLRAKVKKDAVKHKIGTWKSGREKRRKAWRAKVEKMPLKRRFNPVYRTKRWFRFYVAKRKQHLKNRAENKVRDIITYLKRKT